MGGWVGGWEGGREGGGGGGGGGGGVTFRFQRDRRDEGDVSLKLAMISDENLRNASLRCQGSLAKN